MKTMRSVPIRMLKPTAVTRPFMGCSHHRLVSWEDGVKAVWASVENPLQGRESLVPMLASIVNSGTP